MSERFKKILNDYESMSNINQGVETLSSDSQISDNEKELDYRNKLYSNLLHEYVGSYTETQEKKNKKKWFFYRLIIIVFCCLIAVAIAIAIVVTIFYKDDKIVVLITYFSAFIGLLSALITIPNTIAKYLFNPQEDEVITKIVTEMQKQDNINREINQKALNYIEKKAPQKKIIAKKKIITRKKKIKKRFDMNGIERILSLE